jgi:LmbE family N-acetylglucosaminyl deacetylase
LLLKEISFLDKKRILVFAPHPDDETFGCGGTIAKRISEGYEVLIVVMTDGRHAFLHVLGIDFDPSPEKLKELRKEEVKRAARILGVPEDNLIFLDFIDGTLKNNKENAEEKVAKIMSENRPVEVYLPHQNDGHPDHRAAYWIVRNSMRKMGISTLTYQYSIMHKYARLGPLINDFLSPLKKHIVRVDISNFLPIKEAAAREFKTELTAVSNRQHKPVIRSIRRFLKYEEVFYIDKKDS